jgi:hypothetical protein
VSVGGRLLIGWLNEFPIVRCTSIGGRLSIGKSKSFPIVKSVMLLGNSSKVSLNLSLKTTDRTFLDKYTMTHEE